jgi:CPA2 family monovalent cation:H+ antiporter-2
MELAGIAIPARGAADLARAPREALVSTIQLGILAVVGIPILLATQPFVPPFRGAIVFVGVLGAGAIAFWRSVRDVHGHVRAGAEVILGSLKQQMAPEETERTLDQIETQLSGVGSLSRVEVKTAPPAGKSLGDLNLRGATGATALVILRGEKGSVNPTAGELLQIGDVLVLTGTQAALRAAKSLLSGAAEFTSAAAAGASEPDSNNIDDMRGI